MINIILERIPETACVCIYATFDIARNCNNAILLEAFISLYSTVLFGGIDVEAFYFAPKGGGVNAHLQGRGFSIPFIFS